MALGGRDTCQIRHELIGTLVTSLRARSGNMSDAEAELPITAQTAEIAVLLQLLRQLLSMAVPGNSSAIFFKFTTFQSNIQDQIPILDFK